MARSSWDSSLLENTQQLPVGDEESRDTPNPGRHYWLSGHHDEFSAFHAVVALRVPVLPQQFATIRAGASHGLISGVGRKKW